MKKIIWTTENIRLGFEQYQLQHGRLPTAHEIDKLDYLPSSRLIQKRFGGLEKLREKLGYKDVHFGKKDFRSSIAHRVNKRGRDEELKLEKALVLRFGEVFVHTEKIFDSSKNRVDFYIYSPDGNFGIDIFYSDSLQSLQSNVNIKMSKYNNFPTDLYFVSANNLLDQDKLDQYVQSRKTSFPENFFLITLEILLKLIEKMRIYPNPLK